MKLKPLVLLLPLLSIGACGWAKDYSIWTTFGTSKYLRGETPEQSTPVKLDSARNEHEAFQIIIKADRTIESVRVAVSDLKGKAGIISKSNIDVRLAHYIELTESLGGGFERGFYPDALLPMPSDFSVEQGNSQMIWVNVYTPMSAKPGVYTGNVTLTIDGKTEKVPVGLNVRSFALSVESHFGSAFALWAGQCADYYGLDQKSAEYKQMVEKYYWFMVGYRLPPDDLPVSVDSPEAARYLNDPRVTSYRIPYDPDKPDEFKARVAYLRKNGWLDKGYVYTIDEPAASDYGKCAEYGRAIDALAPDAKWLLTAAPHESMIGAVDIWCPVLSNYVQKDCQAEQAKGRHVWWYTCCGPQHPYPTYLINDSAVSPRILSWFQSMYKVEGVLYWSISVWYKWDGSKYVKRDVWKDPLAFPGANGDGYLIYPGKTYRDNPVPTLRLEMIRQGNEDFETFYILQNRYAQLANALGVSKQEFDPNSRVADYVGRMGMSMTRWKADSAVMEKTRKEVLDDIGSVGVGPKVLVKTSVPEQMLTGEKSVAVKVWTEPGTKISVKVYANGVSKAVAVKLTGGGKNARAELSVPLNDESVKLVISAVKGKAHKTVSRTFRTHSRKPLQAVAGEVVCKWTSAEDVEKWETSNASIELAKTERIGECAKVTFNANVDFPNIKLNYPKGFADPDWSRSKYAAMPVYNPNDFPVSFVIKVYDQEGKKFDGYQVYLDPDESRIVSWNLQELAEQLDTSKLSGYEFWMWNRPEPASLYMGPIVLTDTKPASEQ